MEYILHRVICAKIDSIEEMSEMYDLNIIDPELAPTTIHRIPEPDRSVVIKALQEDAFEDFTAEEMIKKYEDLREYIETCFWDFDFDMLNLLPEDTLVNSTLGESMGLVERHDPVQVEVKIAGKSLGKTEVEIPPWEIEFGM